jgi:zinc transport system ATP-binding protein
METSARTGEAVVFRHVYFAYRDQSPPMALLNDVDFTVQAGECAAIIGDNGSGKTTLLKLLIGELYPQAGEVLLWGENSRQFHHWPRVGYVGQNSTQVAANFPATALEIVQGSLYARARSGWNRRQLRETALQALAAVDLEAQAATLMRKLSGGQQQRVMIARVLANAPELMILDEPTTGLDHWSIDALTQILRRLHQDQHLTLLLVTHDLLHAAAFSDRTFCLEEASLLELNAEQVQHELQHRHRHPVAQRIKL